MKKSKKYLIFSAVVILSFVIMNCVSTEETNASPTEPPMFAGDSTESSIPSCAKEGEKFSSVYKDQYPEKCCESLTEWHSGMDTRKVINGKCITTNLLSGNPVGICINCGNEICEDIENICNCPEDCNLTTEKLPPTPTLMNTKTPKSSLVPSLVQQEIKKVKTLQERIGQTGTSNNNLQNTNGAQGMITGQTQQNRNDEIKNRRMEQIKRYTKNVAERFRALLTREHQIKNRIQTRIEKLEENGFDMSPAEQLLLETDISFETIKTKIEALGNDVSTTVESNDQEMVEDLFKRIKTETISLKRETQEIHTKLVQAVKTAREEITKQQLSENENNNETTNE